ncbi:MAG: tetratricopeptide repeat protein [Minisyncoccia bacterium]
MPPQQTGDSAHATSRRSLDTVSALALIITLVAVLLIFTPGISVAITTSKTFLLAAGALVTLVIYIFARLARGNAVFPPLVLLGAIWLPVLAYAFSSVFSGVSFSNALWGTALEPDTLGALLIVATVGTLSALTIRRPEHYRTFLSVGAYTFGLVALLQLLVILVGQFAPNFVSPAFSFLGSSGDLASFLGLGVIATLVSVRFTKLSQRTKTLLIVAGAISLFLLAVQNSTLVWVLLAIVSLGLFVESVMRRGSKGADADIDDSVVLEEESPVEAGGGTRSLVFPLTVLAISLFFLIGSTLGNALASSLHITILNIRPSWQSTFSVAHSVYGTSPIFGTGPSTFGADWLKYRDPSLNTTVFWDVDFTSGIGFIPTSFATIGILGILAWLAFFGLFLVLGLRTLIFRSSKDAYVQYVSILSFLASVYLFTIAVFDLPNVVILGLAFVFAGLFVSTTRYAANGKQWGIVFSRSPRLGFVIVFSLTILLLASVVAAYALVGRYIAVKELADASTAFAAGNYALAEQSAQNAVAFAPNAAAYQVEAGVATAHLSQIASSSTLPAAAAQQQFQNELSAGITAALTATRYAPNDYQNWLALGNLYGQAVPIGVSGAYSAAATAYKKAETLNPTNPQIPYILAQLDIVNKDTKSAEADLKTAIQLKPDYTAAIFLLSQLEVQDGNLKDALTAALAAAYFTPNDPNILFQVGLLSAASGDYATAEKALQGSVAANPQFANARYFLAAIYAKNGDYSDATQQIQAVSAMSADNAKSVATQLAALQAGKDPFPANLLSVASSTPVTP